LFVVAFQVAHAVAAIVHAVPTAPALQPFQPVHQFVVIVHQKVQSFQINITIPPAQPQPPQPQPHAPGNCAELLASPQFHQSCPANQLLLTVHVQEKLFAYIIIQPPFNHTVQPLQPPHQAE